ncbi:hypothetical protein [Reichenbachiella ulvae]|uniref:Uncharacterized protein n=1 Tax=Reichenbachiella ulvae TaxID=2980104 RepID=A0ABT3CVQ7_9BACT|nr:hypothetical protein [Reichenbachiella ulvae]MCV9387624.1 hypothetical protein [Reichenbachiella ulvae]
MTESTISIVLGTLTILVLLAKRLFPSIQNNILLLCQGIISVCFCAIGLYHFLADIMAYQISGLALTQQDLMANLCDILVIALGVVILNDSILAMNYQKLNLENQPSHWMFKTKQFMLSIACVLAGLYDVYAI